MLTAPGITQAILAADPTLVGPTWLDLAVITGNAVLAWVTVPSNVVVQGVTSGAAGTGAVLGKIAVAPSPLPVSAAFLTSGLVGVLSPAMSRAIGTGVAVAFNASAQYRGVSAGVGTGTDVSKVTLANGVALAQAFVGVAAARGFVGVQIPDLARAIGTGVANLLLSGTGTGVVTGPSGPAPAAGTSLSSVF